jgi:hypothetical protein
MYWAVIAVLSIGSEVDIIRPSQKSESRGFIFLANNVRYLALESLKDKPEIIECFHNVDWQATRTKPHTPLCMRETIICNEKC